MPKDDQNSRNSLPLSESEMTSLPQKKNNLRAILAALRKVYAFIQLPKECFTVLEPLPENPQDLVNKPRLPSDTKKIITESRYNFLIEDKEEAKQFVREISTRYSFILSLLSNIIVINLTKKPELPWDSRKVKDVNLTIPITSTKQLVNTSMSKDNTGNNTDRINKRNYEWTSDQQPMGMTETEIVELSNHKLYLTNPYYNAYIAKTMKQQQISRNQGPNTTKKNEEISEVGRMDIRITLEKSDTEEEVRRKLKSLKGSQKAIYKAKKLENKFAYKQNIEKRIERRYKDFIVNTKKMINKSRPNIIQRMKKHEKPGRSSWYDGIEKKIKIEKLKGIVKEASTRKAMGPQAVSNKMIKRIGKKSGYKTRDLKRLLRVTKNTEKLKMK
ncbi:hypothetical protein C2G38_2166358 [Gigaspora rosea]|uniref:Uncharacterized protein n=1 Tax=Gigaspora rosea TaxID=44941 RepID=A0A397VTK1_9GLOM|nr:hypothetical protein C2G38_2166358 [Gigaspora rosea]